MRLEFLQPAPGEETPEMVRDMMGLAGVRIDVETLRQWTRTELVVAFDWASREHLAASDNRIKRRPKPWFVAQAQVTSEEPAEARLREETWKLLAQYPAGVSPSTLLFDGLLVTPEKPRGPFETVFVGIVQTWLQRLEADGRAREFTPGLWVALSLESEATEHEH